MRKTEPQYQWFSITPLSTEPRAMPPVMAPDQMAMACPRWRSSWKRFRTRASVDGIRVAPPMPSRTRAAISNSALVAKPAPIEARPKALAPIRSSLRRPIRSPSEPIVMSRPERAKA